MEWISPSGQAIRVRTVRLVSFTQRAVVAFLYEVEAVDSPARLILQSELVANEQLPPTSKDPRVAAVLDHPLQAEELLEQRTGGLLVHRTKASDLRMAAAMEHLVEAPGKHAVTTEGHPDWLRTTVACKLEPGQKLRVVKLAAYGWSSNRSLPAVRDQVGAALASARLDGWEGLVEAQRDYLDAFWDHSDVKVEGDPEVQQAVRFGLFHMLQSGARAEQRPIGSKGLTGPGYDGHTFWDAETFVLLSPDLHPAVRGRGRAALAALDAGSGPGARADPRPARRGLPVAHHPRAGVLGLLVSRHGRLPHRRRHRRRRAPLRLGDR
nr:hypothetical protein GCM10020092_103650 [Actinoplanes digitatis]